MTGELLPVIFTAALMIAGATLTLLISGCGFSPPSGRHGGGGDRRRGGRNDTGAGGAGDLWPGAALATRRTGKEKGQRQAPRARNWGAGRADRRRDALSCADRRPLRLDSRRRGERIGQAGAGQPGDARLAAVDIAPPGL